MQGDSPGPGAGPSSGPPLPPDRGSPPARVTGNPSTRGDTSLFGPTPKDGERRRLERKPLTQRNELGFIESSIYSSFWQPSLGRVWNNTGWGGAVCVRVKGTVEHPRSHNTPLRLSSRVPLPLRRSSTTATPPQQLHTLSHLDLYTSHPHTCARGYRSPPAPSGPERRARGTGPRPTLAIPIDASGAPTGATRRSRGPGFPPCTSGPRPRAPTLGPIQPPPRIPSSGDATDPFRPCATDGRRSAEPPPPPPVRAQSLRTQVGDSSVNSRDPTPWFAVCARQPPGSAPGGLYDYPFLDGGGGDGRGGETFARGGREGTNAAPRGARLAPASINTS